MREGRGEFALRARQDRADANRQLEGVGGRLVLHHLQDRGGGVLLGVEGQPDVGVLTRGAAQDRFVVNVQHGPAPVLRNVQSGQEALCCRQQDVTCKNRRGLPPGLRLLGRAAAVQRIRVEAAVDVRGAAPVQVAVDDVVVREQREMQQLGSARGLDRRGHVDSAQVAEGPHQQQRTHLLAVEGHRFQTVEEIDEGPSHGRQAVRGGRENFLESLVNGFDVAIGHGYAASVRLGRSGGR